MSAPVAILIFELVVLIFSVIIHEISHGYIAEWLGDPTARLAGRLTLNPISHIDPVGSILVPIVSYFLFGFPFGWAKPVPYNPYNLSDPKSGGGKIAAAGPLSNLTIAVIFGVLGFFLPFDHGMKTEIARGLEGGSIPLGAGTMPMLYLFFIFIAYINIVLAVFNLVPIPPLDGSKVLFAFLPASEWGYAVMQFLDQYGMFLVLLFIFFGFQIIIPVVHLLYHLIVWIPF